MRRPPGRSRLIADTGARWAAARAAAVTALLAVAVAGLRARGALSHQASSSLVNAGARVAGGAFGVAEGAGLVACAVALVLALRRPRRRTLGEAGELPDKPPPWWAKVLLQLLALVIVAAPAAILLAGRHGRHNAPPALLLPLVPRPGRGPLTAPGGGSLVWPQLAGALLAVTVLVILAVAARRRRRNTARWPARARGAASLAAALAAGRDALLAGGEPRAAIIACYAAMERGFAAAGSAPAAADTPAEVLARAGHAGLVRSDAAEALTSVFRRARYSRQPMTGADADAAASALARMRADLESAGPETAAPENAAPGSAGPENTGPGSAAPGSAGPENAGPENAAPGSAGPENAGPESAGLGSTA